MAANGVDHRVRAVRPCCLAGGEGDRDLRSHTARVGRQVSVAAAHREPIRLSHRGHADDLDREVKGTRHGPHEDELLVVLLAEERDVRPCHVHELGDHCQHSGEVAGSCRALELGAQQSRIDHDRRGRGIGRRVDLVDIWREDHVSTGIGGDGDVIVESARIALEVFARSEL